MVQYTLNEIERRVLGSLMEKAATQSSGYPMTLNALVAACNQKSNRDPVMDLDDEAVWSALKALQERQLVTRVLPPPGSRADKFKHDVGRVFSWQARQRAIMTELMLRGPQTVGELRTRCARMVDIGSIADVSEALQTLIDWDPPLARMLPRAPGQSAVRYTHLLYPDDEAPQQPPHVTETHAPAPLASAFAGDANVRPELPRTAEPRPGALRAEVSEMGEEIADLHHQLAELLRRVEAIEQRLG